VAYEIRPGDAHDLSELLRLLDSAVEWLAARGAEGQWGSAPFSASSAMVDRIARITADGELRIAVDAVRRVVGGYVLGPRPSYAPAIREPERDIEAMVTERALAGRGIGSLLVEDASARARAAGVHVVRTDCWAGAPRLVRWYEERGFERGDVVDVDGWPAQLLRMPLERGQERATTTAAVRSAQPPGRAHQPE
jgi:GNAT superfamily N-acetyltransferase